MRHRVTASLVVSKLPSSRVLGIEFFEDPNFKCYPAPKLGITSNKKCEVIYRHVRDVELRTPYYIRTEIETNDEALIEDLAKIKFERIINNLSFLLNDFWGEYKIVKIETWAKEEWKIVRSIFSDPIRLPIRVNPTPLETDKVEKLEKLINIEDEIYKKSLYYLSKGEKRLNRDLNRGEDRIDPGTFLNLFKPIELISNELGQPPEREIPESWKEDFVKMWDKGDRGEAIKEITENYKRLLLRNLPDRIKCAANRLRLKQEDINKAIEFNQIRSKFDVAHAHKRFYSTKKIDYAALSSLSRKFIIKYLELRKFL